MVRGEVAVLLSVVAAIGGGVAGCKRAGNAEGAKALLQEFLKPGADRASLTKALRPTTADYAALFEGDGATKAESVYSKLWNDPRASIGAARENTELLVWSATTDELRAGTGDANNFPGGYREVASKLKPGLTIYRWKYVKPGEKLGMAFDGLVYVNGRWAWFPKPWRALRGPDEASAPSSPIPAPTPAPRP